MNVGDVLERSAHVERINLVMYAGASGDFNPIHWNETFAKAVGLPDVIAHGMYTQAQLGTLLHRLVARTSTQVRAVVPAPLPLPAVLEHDAHLGVALDGDADRVIIVDERGEIVDGDAVMALIGTRMLGEGKLNKDTLVVTVMSNLGLERCITAAGGKIVRTAVGDRDMEVASSDE